MVQRFTMLRFHEKRKLQKVMYSRAMLVLLSVPLVMLTIAVWNSYETERETYARETILKAELAELELRATELDQSITEFEDSRGIEAGLRHRYEVGREGEEIIIFLEEDGTISTPIQPENEETSFWGNIFDTVF